MVEAPYWGVSTPQHGFTQIKENFCARRTSDLPSSQWRLTSLLPRSIRSPYRQSTSRPKAALCPRSPPLFSPRLHFRPTKRHFPGLLQLEHLSLGSAAKRPLLLAVADTP